MKKTFITLLFAICSMFVSAQSGLFDTTFNGTGKIFGNFLPLPNVGSVMVVQPDDKIIIAGSAQNSSPYYTGVRRYNTDGTIDITFGTGGTLLFSSGSNEKVYEMHLQNDGKIVMAGLRYFGSQSFIQMIRLNPDGTFDNTFGVNGIATFGSGQSVGANSFAINADGSFIVVGIMNNNFALIKVNNNGTINTSFGINGWVETTFPSSLAKSNNVSVNANGRIIVGGSVAENGSRYAFAIAAYNPDGTSDTTFCGRKTYFPSRIF